MVDQSKSDPKAQSSWLESICAYFRDFLDTDFKKVTSPKRQLISRDSTGNLTGVLLSKYSDLVTDTWKLLGNISENTTRELSVKRNKYKSRFSKSLSDLINKQIDSVSEKILSEIIEQTKLFTRNQRGTLKNDPERYRNEVLGQLRTKLLTAIINPLLGALAAYFEKQGDHGIESLFNLEEELGQRVVEPLTEAMSVAVATAIVDGSFDDIDVLITDACALQNIKSIFLAFFDNLTTTDFFTDLSSLKATTRLKENLELYLYVGSMKIANSNYPLFCIPVELSFDASTFKLSAEPHILINKRAIDFAIGEIAKALKQPVAFTLPQRILYLDTETSFLEILQPIMDQLTQALSVNGQIDFGQTQAQKATNTAITVDNSLFVAVYDQSDESILNDYEALLNGLANGAPSAATLESIISEFMFSNPVSIDTEVDEEWRSKDIEDRLVYESPIPLNEEQQKIISGLHSKDCKFIAVEGPPGTGKSHTITACVFDYILKGKNVLILSDKREALDVAEEKIRQTLRRVRVDEKLQDPILRFGKHGNSYAKILSAGTLAAITASQNVARSTQVELERELAKKESELKGTINQLSSTSTTINLNEVAEAQKQELDFEAAGFDLSACIDSFSFRRGISAAHTIARLSDAAIFQNCLKLYELEHSLEGLGQLVHIQRTLSEVLSQTSLPSEVFEFSKFDHNGMKALEYCIAAYGNAKKPIVGYALSKGELLSIASVMHERFGYKSIDKLPRNLDSLRVAARAFGEFDIRLNQTHFEHDFYKNGALAQILSNMTPNQLDLDSLEQAIGEYTEAFTSDSAPYLETLGLSPNNLTELLKSRQKTNTRIWIASIADHIESLLNLEDKFNTIPQFDYAAEMRTLQDLQTQILANKLDKSVLDFANNKRNFSKQIKEIIQKKQKFPHELFTHLKAAFPIMIAGIRDFAEYVPLEGELFDLLIIDEASQVSIAQALPAFLRAKKILVLGDRKQFANVKTATASKTVNQQYKTQILDQFKKENAAGTASTNQVQMFDIKTSVLEFVERIANLKIMLKKHFRGYPELIGFSSKYFYGGALQAVKIRGIPVSSVIEFREIAHDGKLEIVPKTNEPEALAILDELRGIVSNGSGHSVCIITPHTEQQKKLLQKISSEADGQDLIDKLNLKVFTFNTCQGEERDIVIYSLVASKSLDRLNYIFPSDIQTSEDAEESLRLQRLNVGFSRAKEKILIFHSKPIGEFKGGLKTALQYYANCLSSESQGPEIADVDPRSPMEAQVLHWLRQVPILEELSEAVEIDAQFEIGKYLQQLDPAIRLPLYRVDFLIKVRRGNSLVQIVVEYDGFREHFVNLDQVNDLNFGFYMKPEDVERQLILEGYGYKFLRINRFNVGVDPIGTLDDRIRRLISESTESSSRSGIIEIVKEKQTDLTEGRAKVCYKCGEARAMTDFFDLSLAGGAGGFGRICNPCKSSGKESGSVQTKIVDNVSSRIFLNCPFEEKDACKKLGGRWDFYKRKWYVPSGIDPAPFSKWR